MNAGEANDTNDAAQRLQRALYRAAKASPARRFHALDDKVYREDILERAWREVQAGGAGDRWGRRLEVPPPDASAADLVAVQTERSKVRQGLARLINSYAEGSIDFVIVCRAAGAAPEGRSRVERTLSRLGLTLPPTKTRVGNASRQFARVDQYVRERVALFRSKKAGRSGRRRERHSLACFRALGLRELTGIVAWATAPPTATR